MAQASPTRFACTEAFGASRLKSFEGDGSARHERDLPASFDGEELTWSSQPTAGADGLILLTASSRIPLGEITGARLFVFRDEPDLPIETSAFMPTVSTSPFGGSDPSLIDSSGLVLVPADGRIYAFTTNLRGLAPSSYPRGPLLGGNDTWSSTL